MPRPSCEEGGVRRISGWSEAGRGRRGAPSGRGGSGYYMVDAILSAASYSTYNA